MSRRGKKRRKPLVDIIIPVYGRFDLLSQCLEALPEAANGIEYQTILVFNGFPEKDKEDEAVKALPRNVISIRNVSNAGFPKACNIGVRTGDAPLIFLLNSDVILEPNSINLMVRDLDDPKIGVVGAHLIFPEYAGGLNQQARPANTTQHIGLETDIHGNWRHIFVGWSSDHHKVMGRRDTYAVTGAALMTRRNLWREIDGLDEGYGLGTYEDADFCMSVRKLGYNIVVNPHARGIHYTGASAEEYRIQFPMPKNKMYFLQKWEKDLVWSEGMAW